MRWIDNILPRIINFLKTINGGISRQGGEKQWGIIPI